MDDESMSPRAARQLLGVHRSTLSRYVEQGLLTRYRTPGGHSRYLRSEIERIMRDPPKAGRPRKEQAE